MASFLSFFTARGPEEQQMPSTAGVDSKHAGKALEKLRGYYNLAQDALERAYAKDKEGAHPEAIKLYRMGLNVIYEGLGLAVPSSGLGPTHNNVARWRHHMNQWQQHVLDRLRVLESPTASTCSAPPTHSIPSTTAAPNRPPLQTSSSAPQPHLLRLAQPSPTHSPRAPQMTSQRRVPASAPQSALSKEEARLREMVLAEVLDTRPSVAWADIAGLASAKQALQEMVILPSLRADLFQGLRAPARGLLLYGPPGNGKTMLAKALAHEAKATFFNISASSLTSKWHGEAEKLVRMLFRTAAEMQPAIVFIDEIDSILSVRSSGEHEASRRLKTEFLVHFDGIAATSDRVVVIGATNRPQELDDAIRRRLVKRIYIPLPDPDTRRALLSHTLKGQSQRLSQADVERVVQNTEGYSGSDLAALCREAAMVPIRQLGSAVTRVAADRVRPIELEDFAEALHNIKPSVGSDQLAEYEHWTQQFGMV